MNLEQNEKLPKVEFLPEAEQSETASDSGFNEDTVISLFNERQQTLGQIKPWVGLKFFYRTAEKVKQEEAHLRRLLRLENAKQTVLSDYSFVLDPAYFEQKFLTQR